MVTLNFGIQLLVDLLSTKFVDKIGYRICIVLAHVFITVGLIFLGVLPGICESIFGNAYVGIGISVVIYAIGGGLTEVLISPIIEACPSDGKAAQMSLLHSFYCWGSVLVVVLSTVVFAVFGRESWPMMSLCWAVIPLLNTFYFMLVPIGTLVEEGESMTIGKLVSTRLFWVLALLMMCAGASELAMSQWASAFAESGLQVSKTVGDLAGPCFFAVLMGTSRIIHAKIGERFTLTKYLGMSAGLCIVGYLLTVLSPIPMLSLIGCGICGFAVGAMWPGTFSLASEKCPTGGTAMFALLALAGDSGCALGPAIVGFVSGAAGDSLKAGLGSAILFPVLLLVGLVVFGRLKG